MASTKPTKPPTEFGDSAPDGTRGLLDALARTAMSKLAGESRRGMQVDHDAAGTYLTKAVLDISGYDQRLTIAELDRRRIDAVAILDICVPKAAEALGEGWVNDEISFTQVSAAASRLYGICKAVGREWDHVDDGDQALTILLVSFRREDHMLGPGILAQKLRRLGHSVRIMSNTDSDAVGARLLSGRYDCVMVSAASLTALDTAIEELRVLRQKCDPRPPIILGGRALDFASERDMAGSAEIITSDLATAFDELERVWSGKPHRSGG